MCSRMCSSCSTRSFTSNGAYLSTIGSRCASLPPGRPMVAVHRAHAHHRHCHRSRFCQCSRRDPLLGSPEAFVRRWPVRQRASHPQPAAPLSSPLHLRFPPAVSPARRPSRLAPRSRRRSHSRRSFGSTTARHRRRRSPRCLSARSRPWRRADAASGLKSSAQTAWSRSDRPL